MAGPPPKADPQGTWSKPVNTGEWRVKWDYGTVNNGVFTPNSNIGIGGATLSFPPTQGNGTWGLTGPETLTNPPAGTNVRARLQQKVDGVWVDKATAYYPLPITGGGGGG